MDEEIKAAQEIAKTTGKAIDAGEKLGGFFKLVLGDTFVELGGITKDWAKYWRYKNALIINDKVEAIHKKRGIEGKTIPIPLRCGIPLLESASQEDDSFLQEFWVGLDALIESYEVP